MIATSTIGNVFEKLEVETREQKGGPLLCALSLYISIARQLGCALVSVTHYRGQSFDSREIWLKDLI